MNGEMTSNINNFFLDRIESMDPKKSSFKYKRARDEVDFLKKEIRSIYSGRPEYKEICDKLDEAISHLIAETELMRYKQGFSDAINFFKQLS
ncbi:hypothetical protein [Metabacillus litoralis]|uniref:hypothetical protein n=1 Tax=Metabacillus litoralis TaxID=152268 RepID=UPI00203B0886|nr:hypothetical protein [Metabacillus litoralis]MCM3165097.1 hypothetical protein [Metabacillus litoralis]